MPTTADYIDDIQNKRFDRIAELIKVGDISPLNHTARCLLANHLTGEKKKVGRPKDKQKDILACALYDEYRSHRKYGFAPGEHLSFLVRCFEGSCKISDAKKMKRSEIIEKLKKQFFSHNRTMDYNRIEDLITHGKKIRKGQFEIEIDMEPSGKPNIPQSDPFFFDDKY